MYARLFIKILGDDCHKNDPNTTPYEALTVLAGQCGGPRWRWQPAGGWQGLFEMIPKRSSCMGWDGRGAWSALNSRELFLPAINVWFCFLINNYHENWVWNGVTIRCGLLCASLMCTCGYCKVYGQKSTWLAKWDETLDNILHMPSNRWN